MKKLIAVLACGFIFSSAYSQTDSIAADEPEGFELQEYVVRAQGTRKMKMGADNSELITAVELSRAACCSLGESFTTNPSVDVNYSDAATGAKQIKLLGLSGSYVQMLTENVPNLRGVSAPFSLDYVPGAWIQSIQVSKGASSVKNGFESLTGQINVEMLKPQAERALRMNAYFDSDGKLELNAMGNLHIGEKWSGGLLLHGANSFWTHDGNDDGFIDMPRIRRLALVNRWAYMGERYVFQISGKGLIENRKSGQISGHSHYESTPYIIEIDSKRLELFTKNAYIFDKENDGNVALIASGNVQNLDAGYGLRNYKALQYDAYLSLMFERKWGMEHALSAGLSYQYDNYRQHYRLIPDNGAPVDRDYTHEGVNGIYAQYTFNKDNKIILMGGLRYDYNSLYGSFLTPRLHLRWNPDEKWSLHASAGMGSRSPHPMAEYHYLLASSRKFILPDNLRMERGVNTGLGATWSSMIGERKIDISAEYYYTRFMHEMTADLDNRGEVVISTDSKGFSHNVQAEVSFNPIEDMTLTAAYRYTDVKVNYGDGKYVRKPLTSAHKGLFTIGYGPDMGKWQIDATCAIFGGGVMPSPYQLTDGEWSWNPDYPTYCRLNLQVTRNFRNWSVYIGGENLTNYRQKNPIIGASDPWGSEFDATMVWGPLAGAMGYIGIRINLK